MQYQQAAAHAATHPAQTGTRPTAVHTPTRPSRFQSDDLELVDAMLDEARLRGIDTDWGHPRDRADWFIEIWADDATARNIKTQAQRTVNKRHRIAQAKAAAMAA